MCKYNVLFLLGLEWELLGPRNEIAGSYGKMFNFIRNCQAVFQSGSTILYFYQQCITVAQHFFHCLFFFFFLIWLIFYLNYSSSCIVISLLGFNLHLLKGSLSWTWFPMLICHLYIFFDEVLSQVRLTSFPLALGVFSSYIWGFITCDRNISSFVYFCMARKLTDLLTS